MARLSQAEIEQRIAAGAAIREQRRIKKAQSLPKDLPIKLREVSAYLEHVRRGRQPLTDEVKSDVKALFLPEKEDCVKVKAFNTLSYEYENLISLVWGLSDELCDAAFAFWNIVLKADNTSVSGNSILRILGDRPNNNLLRIIEENPAKCLEGPFKAIVAKTAIRKLQTGPFEDKSFGIWTEDEKEIWRKIIQICM